VTFQDDQAGLDLLDHFGPDKVMRASDYPHPDGTFPESGAAIERQTAGLEPEARRRLLGANAAALHRIG
jgi:predicted TIM-barrel fold metal-dependent hydrolase